MSVNAMQVEWNDRMQKVVNAQEVFRQFRAALSITPYSCVFAINALRMFLRGSVGLQEYLSSLELRAPCSSVI